MFFGSYNNNILKYYYYMAWFSPSQNVNDNHDNDNHDKIRKQYKWLIINAVNKNEKFSSRFSMIKVGNYSHPKLIFLLDKLLVIVGNYCPSKHRRCNYIVLCVKTFYLNFFVWNVCLNGNMLYLCGQLTKTQVPLTPIKSLETLLITTI